MAVFAGRTCHGIPRQARTHAAHPVLRLDGLVRHPLALAPADLADLPRIPFRGEISCLETGGVPATAWLGIPLAALIALAVPSPAARFVRVSAGPYGVPVALADAGDALLCDQLAGAPLPIDRGGPWRLVIPGSRYFTSVKWVDHLLVTAEPPDNSAARIADARTRARSARTADPSSRATE